MIPDGLPCARKLYVFAMPQARARAVPRASVTCTAESLVPLKWIEYGIYRYLIIIWPKPYSIFLRGTIGSGYRVLGCEGFVVQAAVDVGT